MLSDCSTADRWCIICWQVMSIEAASYIAIATKVWQAVGSRAKAGLRRV